MAWSSYEGGKEGYRSCSTENTTALPQVTENTRECYGKSWLTNH